MNTEPFGHTVFCDDIRHEVTGKLTLVGCYVAGMGFSEPPPAFVPQFAALVTIMIPKTIEFAKIKLVVLKEEGSDIEEIFEFNREISEEEKANSKKVLADGEKSERMAQLMVPIEWTNLEFRKSGSIKVRAYLDDNLEIRAGALMINFPEASANSSA